MSDSYQTLLERLQEQRYYLNSRGTILYEFEEPKSGGFWFRLRQEPRPGEKATKGFRNFVNTSSLSLMVPVEKKDLPEVLSRFRLSEE